MSNSLHSSEDDFERAATLVDAELKRVVRWKAVHEAGHCVVALSLDWEVGHVSIEQTAELDAHASLKARQPNDRPIDYVRVGLAGAQAVHIENRWGAMVPGQDGGANDEMRIEAMLYAGYPEPAHVEVREQARRETVLILERRWSEVDALASALELEKTLECDRILAILIACGESSSAGCSDG